MRLRIPRKQFLNAARQLQYQKGTHVILEISGGTIRLGYEHSKKQYPLDCESQEQRASIRDGAE